MPACASVDGCACRCARSVAAGHGVRPCAARWHGWRPLVSCRPSRWRSARRGRAFGSYAEVLCCRPLDGRGDGAKPRRAHSAAIDCTAATRCAALPGRHPRRPGPPSKALPRLAARFARLPGRRAADPAARLAVRAVRGHATLFVIEDAMHRNFLRWLLPAAVAIAVSTGSAQAQPRSAAQPDPLDPTASVPPVTHRSALTGYRRLGDDPPMQWREANDAVGRIGGWRAYAREASEAAAPPPSPGGSGSSASVPVAPGARKP